MGRPANVSPVQRMSARDGRTRDSADLFIASLLLIFLEMACIRWATSMVRMAAYFSNIFLIACFFGFGVGCLVKSRRSLLPLFAWQLLAFVGACGLFGGTGLGNVQSATEIMWSSAGARHWIWLLPALFVLLAFMFCTLGQRIAVLMDAFMPLEAYSLNVAGSLWGGVLFAGFSFLSARPSLWFLMVCIGVTWILRRRWNVILLSLLPMAASLFIVHRQESRFLWSPYYKIQILLRSSLMPSGSFYLTVNDIYHQATLNLSKPAIQSNGELGPWETTYNFPYASSQRSLKEVLVLGAGTGNDVAAALRHGATRVHAVELDPLILRLGRELHPEHPYSDPRVVSESLDARYILRQGKSAYDAIIMGWLDSHRIFSTMSNVRQDNFVYTLEAMRQAKALLKPDGLLYLSFCVGKPWVAGKLFAMLKAAFGYEPRVYVSTGGAYGEQGTIFVIGREQSVSWRTPPGFADRTDRIRQLAHVAYPTDDWPYLYYRERRLSSDYVLMLAILAFISIAVMAGVLRKEPAALNAETFTFFFLGAGFMLLEVRNVTALALIFGSTWLVNAVAVCGVLFMSLVAVYLVEKTSFISLPRAWTMLFLWLLVTFFLREHQLPGGPMMRGILFCIVLSLCFVFSGIVFTRLFKETRNSSIPFGFNVLGTVLGGFLEYGNLLIGFRGLLWIAVFLYGAAFYFSKRVHS